MPIENQFSKPVGSRALARMAALIDGRIIRIECPSKLIYGQQYVKIYLSATNSKIINHNTKIYSHYYSAN